MKKPVVSWAGKQWRWKVWREDADISPALGLMTSLRKSNEGDIGAYFEVDGKRLELRLAIYSNSEWRDIQTIDVDQAIALDKLAE